MERIRGEVVKLVGQLDSDRFEARRQASFKLKQLAAEPELGPVLAEEFERVLVLSETSFEVRKQLELLRRGLPRVRPEPTGEVSVEEIERLIRQLEDDSYGKRLGAAARLEWLLGNPKLISPILLRLKRRLAENDLVADAPTWLEPVYEQARGAWLLSDPEHEDLPPVTSEQITQWIRELSPPGAENDRANTPRNRQVAERELKDVLARDEYVPQVKQALESRLAEGDLNPHAAARLTEFLKLAHPAMVAEYWEARHHLGTQHLLVDVPALYPGGTSHFDRIDDRVAHCASGVNLSPGDYPVGVAIPHPGREGALFHLINLPTPRRRMAYEYHAKIDETRRLKELSRRTLDRMLTEGRPLAEQELLMLVHLDAEEVSRFAGKFFLAVEDQPLPAEARPFFGERPSRHGMICAVLITDGTREAIPGLLKAIEDGRFLPPLPDAVYSLPWMAGLAIAGRDPWPQVDAWLSGLLGRTDALIHGQTEGPELGPTAAAVLLKRHQEEPAEFGLEPVADPLMEEIGLAGYRFVSEASRRKVQSWWEDQTKTAQEGKAP